MMFEMSYMGAIAAGLLSFLSPCILPIVPFYLCYMAGISIEELRCEDKIAPGTHRRLIFSSILFALGVTTIFVILGLGATALGQVFRSWKEPLSYIAAGLLFLFGLHFLGVLRIPLLFREARIATRSRPASFVGAYMMGLAFGFGWTPCVGPALSAILMIASSQDSLFHGSSLLLVYGLSMTLPFVLAAAFAVPFLLWVQSKRKYLGHVEKVMGVLLIVFAILISTQSVSMLSQYLIDAFPIFLNVG